MGVGGVFGVCVCGGGGIGPLQLTTIEKSVGSHLQK